MEATKLDNETITLISLPEVRAICGMGTTFIYKEMAAGRFPRRRKVGKKAARWVKEEVTAWVRARPQE